MNTRRYIPQRLVTLLVQVWALSSIVFIIIQLIPGDPSYLLLGQTASPEMVKAMRASLGLDKNLAVRYGLYLRNLLHGDLGSSFFTGRPILSDILSRFPATLELITFSLTIAVLYAIPLGALSALRRVGLANRISFAYGLLAGALPEFWWGLMLIYVLFAQLNIVPAPVGRIDLAILPPPAITGLYTVDSLLALDWRALSSSLGHLFLPSFTLAFIYGGPLLKITRTQMVTVLESDFVRYARAIGHTDQTIIRYALRNALPPVVTLTGMTYSFLIGGAVLIETLFSWDGLGQYAVTAVTRSDYFALTGTVLAMGVFSLIVYIVVDLAYRALDPRAAQ